MRNSTSNLLSSINLAVIHPEGGEWPRKWGAQSVTGRLMRRCAHDTEPRVFSQGQRGNIGVARRSD